MFTGIVEEQGRITQIQNSGDALLLSIQANRIMEDIHLGDSIAIDGVCLTVTTFSGHQFSVDVMPETIKATTLHTLVPGSQVNLERAMSSQGRFGGHFVAGHVDGVGRIQKKQSQGNAVYYEITAPSPLLHYMILKGSVAVDGTSLTIFGLTQNTFTLSLIPHTLSETVLGSKNVGDWVNIEVDMVGKYIEKFITQAKQSSSSITEDFLTENGFK